MSISRSLNFSLFQSSSKEEDFEEEDEELCGIFELLLLIPLSLAIFGRLFTSRGADVDCSCLKSAAKLTPPSPSEVALDFETAFRKTEKNDDEDEDEGGSDDDDDVEDEGFLGSGIFGGLGMLGEASERSGAGVGTVGVSEAVFG